MHVAMLGPLQVRDVHDRPVTVGGARLRALTARLALDAGRPVPAAALADAVWDGDPPGDPANALQSLVTRLRRLLAGAGAVMSGPGGYRLAVTEDDVDTHRFERLAASGARRLAAGDVPGALTDLGAALALWRGPALSDVAHARFAAAPAARLEDRRLAAVEDRAEALVRAGRAADALPGLTALVTEHPSRERACALAVAALDATGRRADALGLHERARRRLAEDLGVDPGPELAAAHLAVLRGEPAYPPYPAADTGISGTSGMSGAAVAAGANAASAPAHPGRPAPEPVAPPPDPGLLPAPDAGPTPPDPGLPAPDAGPTPPDPGLPARLTSFVGRDPDIARLTELLGETRLVTLVGPGGAGKTRLALETGARLAPGFPGGVRLVELAPVREAADVPQAVLASLGRRARARVEGPGHPPPSAGDAGDPLDRVVDILDTGRPLLLVLDNCEHVVGTAAALAHRLLTELPAIRVIATTREPLGVPGERLHPLGPLALPAPGAGPEEAARAAAVRLFLDRARAVRPDLNLDRDNAAAVAEICRRLDGMPLAIELAAARTRAMTPHQIAGRLDDRFRLLTGGHRTALPRHQTLRAVVAWSWDLLDERERAVARRLSVFAGGATAEDAEAVVADDDLVPREDVLDVLAALVDRSLVDATGATTTRYRMLETIQAYAAEHLAVSGERDRVRAAHLARFAALAQEAEPHLRTAAQLTWLARLGAEHDNLARALHTAQDLRDADAAVRMTAALGAYWMIHGAEDEARTWLRDALAVPGPVTAAEALAVVHLMYGAAEMAKGGAGGLRHIARARLLTRRLPRPATHPLLRHLDVLTAFAREDVPAVAAVLAEVTDDAGDPGDPGDAGTRADPWVGASARLVRGHLAVNTGHVTEALAHMVAAYDAFTGIGERWGAATAATGLAELHMLAGDHDAAVTALDEALGLVRELGAVDDLPFVLARRATVHVRAGRPDAARADATEVLRLCETRDGLASGRVPARATLGEIALVNGDIDEAERQFTTAHTLLRRARAVPHQVTALTRLGLARVALARGDLDTAREYLAVALHDALAVRDMPVVAWVVEGAAATALAEGDAARCAELLGVSEALRGCRDAGSAYVPALVARAEQALGEGEFARLRARAADRPRAQILAELRAAAAPHQARRR